MEEGALSRDFAKIEPDKTSALFALDLASEALLSARERFFRGEYRVSLEESRNAMRLASSALMFRDGYVGGSLDAAVFYISRRYPGMFPVEAWESVERIPVEDTPGLYNMVLSALGRLRKAGEKEARDAIVIAEMFLESAKQVLP